MLGVPNDLAGKYGKLLEKDGIPRWNPYHVGKRLRYYLDFCHKCQCISDDRDSLACFVRKLHEKNQSPYQQKQASPMHKKYMVRLTAAERKTLVEAIRKLKGTSEKVRHTQILLQADVEGPAGSDARIGEAFNCRVHTIENLRKRLVTEDFEFALNR